MKTHTLLGIIAFMALARSGAAQTPPLTKPTPEHAHLTREVGVWDAKSSTWATPDAEPTHSTGIETNRMLGKTWLISDFDGDNQGEKFSGHMQLGYDPLKKKFVGTWIDSIEPFLFTMEGDYDNATHTWTLMMTGTSALTGKPETAKLITRYLDDDTKVFEMHMPVEGKNGEWWKFMETKYTRRK